MKLKSIHLITKNLKKFLKSKWKTIAGLFQVLVIVILINNFGIAKGILGFVLFQFLIIGFRVLRHWTKYKEMFKSVQNSFEISIWGRPIDPNCWTKEEWETIKKNKWKFYFRRLKL